MVLDRYDAGEDVRSAAGWLKLNQVLPWYSKDGEIKPRTVKRIHW